MLIGVLGQDRDPDFSFDWAEEKEVVLILCRDSLLDHGWRDLYIIARDGD